jgi:divalent metal cation (Fe/Co/Zn/Cd) transporter
MASAIVIWRFTGPRTLSEYSERCARRWVAGSFFLLAPYFLYEAVDRLIHGTRPDATVLAIALTASSVVLMPLLGRVKLRLGRRLDSGATSGEGVQNLLCAALRCAALRCAALRCAAQALAALTAVIAVPGLTPAFTNRNPTAVTDGNCCDFL